MSGPTVEGSNLDKVAQGDDSKEPSNPTESTADAPTSSSDLFPAKLHQLLEDATKDGNDDVISWLPDGKSFKVHDKVKFASDIMPKYFGSSKYRSFQKNLNLWGFKAPASSPNRGECSHPLFVRESAALCRKMKRVVKSKSRKPDPQQEQPKSTAIPESPGVASDPAKWKSSTTAALKGGMGSSIPFLNWPENAGRMNLRLGVSSDSPVVQHIRRRSSISGMPPAPVPSTSAAATLPSILSQTPGLLPAVVPGGHQALQFGGGRPIPKAAQLPSFLSPSTSVDAAVLALMSQKVSPNAAVSSIENERRLRLLQSATASQTPAAATGFAQRLAASSPMGNDSTSTSTAENQEQQLQQRRQDIEALASQLAGNNSPSQLLDQQNHGLLVEKMLGRGLPTNNRLTGLHAQQLPGGLQGQELLLLQASRMHGDELVRTLQAMDRLRN